MISQTNWGEEFVEQVILSAKWLAFLFVNLGKVNFTQKCIASTNNSNTKGWAKMQTTLTGLFT